MENSIAVVVNLMKLWMAQKKVGNIQVNFFKGGVTTVNLNETRKLQEIQLPKGKDEK